MLPIILLTGISWLSFTFSGTVQAIQQHKNIHDKDLVNKKRDEVLLGKIMGGEQTSIENHPWQVSIQNWHIDQNKPGPNRFAAEHICGGSIIGEQWVMTAHHCGEGIANTINTPESTTVIVAGVADHDAMAEENPNQRPGNVFYRVTKQNLQEFTELRWYIDAGFHEAPPYGTTTNDIALIQILEGSFIFNDQVNKIEFSNEESYVEKFDQCQITGFGQHSEDHLAVLDVELLNTARCTDEHVNGYRRMLEEPGILKYFLTTHHDTWHMYLKFDISDEVKQMQAEYNASNENEDLKNRFKAGILQSAKQNFSSTFKEDMICVFTNDTKKSACHGDSGGPLTCIKKSNGERYLVGVTSGMSTEKPYLGPKQRPRGTWCEKARFEGPIYYTNIAWFSNWICNHPIPGSWCFGKTSGADRVTSALWCVWSLALLSVCLTIW